MNRLLIANRRLPSEECCCHAARGLARSSISNQRSAISNSARGLARSSISNQRSAISNSARGLTLLEVILGLAIFVGSLAVLTKLVELGVRGSQFAQLHTRAVILAESKMGEIVAGLVPLNASGGRFEEDAAWQWQATVADGPVAGLAWVSITVGPSATGELASHRGEVEFTLSRWVLDPEYSAELDAAAEEMEAVQSEATP